MKTMKTAYEVFTKPGNPGESRVRYSAESGEVAVALGTDLATKARRLGIVEAEAKEIRSVRLQLFCPQEKLIDPNGPMFWMEPGWDGQKLLEVPADHGLEQEEFVPGRLGNGVLFESSQYHEAGQYFGIRVWRGDFKRNWSSHTSLYETQQEAEDAAAQVVGNENGMRHSQHCTVRAVEILSFEAKTLGKWLDRAPQLDRVDQPQQGAALV
jgi:hypothetical protein